MCGLAGVVTLGPRTADELKSQAVAMAGALRHRGPDDDGVWVDPEAGVAIGFRRLSIVDRSTAGHQPMESASGRYVIAFNGEVYNFERLRRQLIDAGLAPQFRGHSDTEVMLASIEAWGVERAVKEFIGMFAFALWDRRERRLYLVRDRIGVKPLYYGWAGDSFVFASELRAVEEHRAFRGEIDLGALRLFARFSYVPAPYTIYKGFQKLLPGSIVTFDLASKRFGDPVAYWTALDLLARAGAYEGSYDDAVGEIETLLRDSVRLRMIADVPLGVFLSGGIDSSVIAAMMQSESARRIATFTIGFRETAHDEAPFALKIAEHLGTEHTEVYVTSDDALKLVPSIASMWDEPFADSSQIPTHLVSSIARQHVTVALSGDGGDELFAGYERYFRAQSIWKRVSGAPLAARRALAASLRAVAPDTWDRLYAGAARAMPATKRIPRFGAKVHKAAELLSSDRPAETYRNLMSYWAREGLVRGEVAELATVFDTVPEAFEAHRGTREHGTPNFLEIAQMIDLLSYLPDEILVKVDRASMAVGLECREPLLDHRMVELAWRLPRHFKTDGRRGKLILRSLLERHLPRALFDRPKQGFSVPVAEWLRGPLRDWAESLLSSERIERDGFFEPSIVRTAWHEHLSRRSTLDGKLWTILMFQAWLDERRSRAKVS